MKYEVYAHVTIGMHCVVEAESKEAALELAEQADMMTMCWSCAESAQGQRSLKLDEWRTSGEFDGTPKIQAVNLYER